MNAPDSLTLFQLAHEYRHMADVLMDSEVDQQTLEDTLSAEGWSLETKATNIAFVIRNMAATAGAIKEAEAQMAQRRKAMENRILHLKEYLKTGMEIARIDKLECPYFAMTIKKNPPSLDVYEPDLVPAEFWKEVPPPPPMLDTAAVKAAIKGGREVPGAQLVSGTRLDIR